MENIKLNISEPVLRFLAIIEEIKSTNKLLKVEPKTNNGIAELVYPADKTIFSKLKNGKRKKVPFDALINLAKHFIVDMNYLFYDGFEINYNPIVLQGLEQGKLQKIGFSDDELSNMNKLQNNSLSLAISMYKKMDDLMEMYGQLDVHKSNVNN